MRIVYVNGKYLSENEAVVSAFDRGFLFADAVYEVTAVLAGKIVDFPGHMARLKRSLAELHIAQPIEDAALLEIHKELVSRNNLSEGIIYLQVSRGAADRDFLYPEPSVNPTVVLFTQAKNLIKNPVAIRGQRVLTAEDLRWQRGDIKSIQLLYACMVKNMAKSNRADDVWLVRDGFVTEGASSNAFIVTTDARIVTHHLSSEILGGITRASVLKCAEEMGLEVDERPFLLLEAVDAKEAFCTSASSLVTPVVQIDDRIINLGKPGEITSKIRELYIQYSIHNGT